MSQNVDLLPGEKLNGTEAVNHSKANVFFLSNTSLSSYHKARKSTNKLPRQQNSMSLSTGQLLRQNTKFRQDGESGTPKKIVLLTLVQKPQQRL